MGCLDVDEVIARAIETTGLTDFGQGVWRDGLEHTRRAFNSIKLTAAGQDGVNAMLVADLSNRLRIEHWYREHPDTGQSLLEPPLLVCGLPRTGTTATVAMLAQDPDLRFLRQWEGQSPVPPPEAGKEEYDPRRLAAHEKAKNYTLGAMHLSDPDGPEEDLVYLSGLSMRSYHGSFPMPDDFIDWWISDDFISTYAYHARVLKLLQSRRPPHKWVLKSPPHLFKLEAFARQFPGTRFIWTHRDPKEVIPSVASLYYALYGLRGVQPTIPKAWVGQRCLNFWREGMARGLDARARIGEHHFVDVYNTDLVRDPITTFQKVYRQLDREWSSLLESRLKLFHERNAKGIHGAHHYSLEEFGLTAAEVDRAFEPYLKRFPLASRT